MNLFNIQMLEFIKKIYYTYVERKESKDLVPQIPGRVVRGTIKAVANSFEDGFAIFLSKFIGLRYSILVDYQFTMKPSGKKIKPDITIVKNGEIISILELKIDLGYEKHDWKEERNETIQLLRESNSVLYHPLILSSLKKEVKTLNVDKFFDFGVVILSQKNGKERINDVIARIESAKCEDGRRYPYFILMRDKSKHPNDFLEKNRVDIYLENALNSSITSDWRRLERYLRKLN